MSCHSGHQNVLVEEMVVGKSKRRGEGREGPPMPKAGLAEKGLCRAGLAGCPMGDPGSSQSGAE